MKPPVPEQRRLVDRRNAPTNTPRMNYSEWAVEKLIRDYRQDFGVQLPYEDVVRMMVLFDMLAEVFKKYEDEAGDDMPSFMSPLLGL